MSTFKGVVEGQSFGVAISTPDLHLHRISRNTKLAADGREYDNSTLLTLIKLIISGPFWEEHHRWHVSLVMFIAIIFKVWSP